MRRSIKIALSLLAVGVLALAACGGSDDEPSEDTSGSITPGAVVNAGRIMGEYDFDPAAADVKYKDKEIEILGTISEVGKTPADIPYVGLGTGWESPPVQCVFPETATELPAEVALTNRLTFKGTVEGLQKSFNVPKEGDISALAYSTGNERLTLTGCSLVQ